MYKSKQIKYTLKKQNQLSNNNQLLSKQKHKQNLEVLLEMRDDTMKFS